MYGNVAERWLKFYQHKNMTQYPKMKEPQNIDFDRIIGLSNGNLCSWEKVEKGKLLFNSAIEESHELTMD